MPLATLSISSFFVACSIALGEANPMVKRILFINLYFEMGGVETLLLRLIKELKNNGFDSTVLLLKNAYDPALMAELLRHAEVRFLADVWSPIPSRIRQRLGGEVFDYIFATINDALLLGALLQQFLYPRAHLIAGVYQTELFCQDITAEYRHREALRNLFCDGVPNANKIFGNDAARAYHEAKLHRNFASSPVVPLMIDVGKYSPPSRENVDRNKIVSVGRICDFKTYNFTMLSVIQELRAEGTPVTYHIYGSGPDEERLQQEIKGKGLADCVFLHGPLEYANFKRTVSDAGVFVGSGTAVMEASACGVPSIPAIEYANEAISYGFLHDIRGTSFFEPNLALTKLRILDLVRTALTASGESYQTLERSALSSVQRFSPENVRDAYIRALENTQNGSIHGARCAGRFAWQLLQSRLYRATRILNQRRGD